MSRLYLKIYAALLATLLVFGALAAALWYTNFQS